MCAMLLVITLRNHGTMVVSRYALSIKECQSSSFVMTRVAVAATSAAVLQLLLVTPRGYSRWFGGLGSCTW